MATLDQVRTELMVAGPDTEEFRDVVEEFESAVRSNEWQGLQPYFQKMWREVN